MGLFTKKSPDDTSAEQGAAPPSAPPPPPQPPAGAQAPTPPSAPPPGAPPPRPKPNKAGSLKKKHDDLKAQVEKLKKDFAAVEKYVLPLTNNVNGYSTATPVTDGKHVYVHFCSGVVACYDMDGNRKWGIITEKPTHF